MSQKMKIKNSNHHCPINICAYSNTTSMAPTKIKLYNPISDTLESVSPYTRKAKQIYRPYIEILNWDPDTFFTERPYI